MYVEREIGTNILSYANFSNICDLIKSFTELKQKLENKMLLFLSNQAQEWLNGEMNIF